jgi:hypothetical protein
MSIVLNTIKFFSKSKCKYNLVWFPFIKCLNAFRSKNLNEKWQSVRACISLHFIHKNKALNIIELRGKVKEPSFLHVPHYHSVTLWWHYSIRVTLLSTQIYILCVCICMPYSLYHIMMYEVMIFNSSLTIFQKKEDFFMDWLDITTKYSGI